MRTIKQFCCLILITNILVVAITTDEHVLKEIESDTNDEDYLGDDAIAAEIVPDYTVPIINKKQAGNETSESYFNSTDSTMNSTFSINDSFVDEYSNDKNSTQSDISDTVHLPITSDSTQLLYLENSQNETDDLVSTEDNVESANDLLNFTSLLTSTLPYDEENSEKDTSEGISPSAVESNFTQKTFENVTERPLSTQTILSLKNYTLDFASSVGSLSTEFSNTETLDGTQKYENETNSTYFGYNAIQSNMEMKENFPNQSEASTQSQSPYLSTDSLLTKINTYQSETNGTEEEVTSESQEFINTTSLINETLSDENVLITLPTFNNNNSKISSTEQQEIYTADSTYTQVEVVNSEVTDDPVWPNTKSFPLPSTEGTKERVKRSTHQSLLEDETTQKSYYTSFKEGSRRETSFSDDSTDMNTVQPASFSQIFLSLDKTFVSSQSPSLVPIRDEKDSFETEKLLATDYPLSSHESFPYLITENMESATKLSREKDNLPKTIHYLPLTIPSSTFSSLLVDQLQTTLEIMSSSGDSYESNLPEIPLTLQPSEQTVQKVDEFSSQTAAAITSSPLEFPSSTFSSSLVDPLKTTSNLQQEISLSSEEAHQSSLSDKTLSSQSPSSVVQIDDKFSSQRINTTTSPPLSFASSTLKLSLVDGKETTSNLQPEILLSSEETPLSSQPSDPSVQTTDEFSSQRINTITSPPLSFVSSTFSSSLIDRFKTTSNLQPEIMSSSEESYQSNLPGISLSSQLSDPTVKSVDKFSPQTRNTITSPPLPLPSIPFSSSSVDRFKTTSNLQPETTSSSEDVHHSSLYEKTLSSQPSGSVVQNVDELSSQRIDTITSRPLPLHSSTFNSSLVDPLKTTSNLQPETTSSSEDVHQSSLAESEKPLSFLSSAPAVQKVDGLSTQDIGTSFHSLYSPLLATDVGISSNLPSVRQGNIELRTSTSPLPKSRTPSKYQETIEYFSNSEFRKLTSEVMGTSTKNVAHELQQDLYQHKTTIFPTKFDKESAKHPSTKAMQVSEKFLHSSTIASKLDSITQINYRDISDEDLNTPTKRQSYFDVHSTIRNTQSTLQLSSSTPSTTNRDQDSFSTNTPLFSKEENSSRDDLRVECNLKPTTGKKCNSAIFKILQWYFDDVSNTCKHFYYYGCGGNANRFYNRASCMAYCKYKVVDLCLAVTCAGWAKCILKSHTNCDPAVSSCPPKLPHCHYRGHNATYAPTYREIYQHTRQQECDQPLDCIERGKETSSGSRKKAKLRKVVFYYNADERKCKGSRLKLCPKSNFIVNSTSFSKMTRWYGFPDEKTCIDACSP